MKEKNAEKKLILAFNHGNANSNLFNSYFDYTKRMFQFLGFDVTNVYVVGDTESSTLSNKINEHIIMKQIGASLV